MERSQHESLQGTEAYPISEPYKIKVTEYILFAFVYAVSKTVCQGKGPERVVVSLEPEPKG